MDKVKKARSSVYKKSIEIKGKGQVEVKGFDFSKKFDLSEFFNSLQKTGFQATELYTAIQIFKKMRENKVTIFFGYTSNMVSCGLREVICYLTKNKIVDVLVTTAGGLEEDVLKLFGPYFLGDYNASGKVLRNKGINRTGNLYIPNSRYIKFEKFINVFLQRLYKKQKETGKIITTTELCYELGKEVEKLPNKEESICYWAYKNNIPLFCPALTDGSFGDVFFFFKQQHQDMFIDMSDEVYKLNKIAINAEKTGIIALGGSVPKHAIANANLFREGTDYAIYLTTAQEYEGSNAGANPEEAKSWGKIKGDAKTIKVVGDCSITFPLLIAGFLYLKK